MTASPSTVQLLDHEAAAGLPTGRDRPWVYVGPEPGETERTLGTEDQLDLGDRLHETAEELRQPFLEFMEEMGRLQEDRERWWASALATRDPHHSDLFRLVCYKALVTELIEDCLAEDRPLDVVIEDPDLLEDLERELSEPSRVEVLAESRGTRVRLETRLQALWVRLLVAVHAVRSWACTLLWDPHESPEPASEDDRPRAAIVGYAQDRSLRSTSFEDPYLPGLEQMLEDAGVRTLRLIKPFHPAGHLDDVAALDGRVWPLVKEFRPWDLSVLFQRWSPTVPTAPEVAGIDIGGLLETAVRRERARAGYYSQQITDRLFRRFFDRECCDTLFLFYENRGWQRLVCLAADENKVRVVGHQHSSIPRFALNFHLGPREAAILPMPDTLVTNGQLWHQIMEESGWPSEVLRRGGALRYRYLFDERETKEADSTILIAPSGSRSLSRRLIAEMKTFAREEDLSDWEIKVKLHPMVSRDDIEADLSGESKIQYTDRPIDELIPRARIAVTASTPTLEAWFHGADVVPVRVDHDLHLGPSSVRGLEELEPVDLGSIRSELSRHLQRAGARADPGSRRDPRPVYDEVDPDVWIDEALEDSPTEVPEDRPPGRDELETTTSSISD